MLAIALVGCGGSDFSAAAETAGGSGGAAAGSSSSAAGSEVNSGGAGGAAAGSSSSAGAAGSEVSSSGASGAAAGSSSGGSSSGGSSSHAGAGGSGACLVGWKGSTCDTCSSSPDVAGSQTCAQILSCYVASHCAGPCEQCEYQVPTSDAVVAVARKVFSCRCP